MKVVAIIQSRLGSTRLPGKVLLNLEGKPVIEHVCNRLQKVSAIDEIIVATTISSLDDEIESWCKKNEINCFRGSEEDVLGRYREASKKFPSDIVVRITCDDPMKDPQIIQNMLEAFLLGQSDVMTNNRPPSFPEGYDVEIMSSKALYQANDLAQDPFEREHVTQFFYKNHEDFAISNYGQKEDLSHIRLTLDTGRDLKVIREVFRKLYSKNNFFGLKEVSELIKSEPHIFEINSNVKRSEMYLEKKDE